MESASALFCKTREGDQIAWSITPATHAVFEECLDALAEADNQGNLAEVRRMAGGMKLGLARRPSKRS